MKFEKMQKRLNKQRPMTTVTLRMPIDVVEDLKRLAPLLGFSGYQPLMKAYVGQNLREDLEHFDNDKVSSLIEALKQRGVNEALLKEALADIRSQPS